MINIPYTFSGTVEYETYEQVKNRAKKFDSYEVFGLDQSGMYEVFFISLGKPTNPCMLITSAMHPPEWQGISYTMAMMEQLRDNTYPDKSLRDDILNNYYLVYVPIMQPYGLDRVLLNKYGIYHSGGEGRRNVNGVDLNSDFYTFNEQESRNIRLLGNRVKPFAYLDVHMYQPDYPSASGRNAIIAGGQQSWGDYNKVTRPITNEWKKSMENYIGESITQWTNILSETSGLARAHFAKQKNPYTPYTLSYISEIVRPAYRNRNGTQTFIRKLSDSNIYKYGQVHNYLFLKTSIKYFEEYGDSDGNNGSDNDNEESSSGLVYKIETPQKTVFVKRDSQGVATSLEEIYKMGRRPNIRTTITRNSKGEVYKINREEI